jgi:uncharacterized protein YndB with AHSA1/START domain
MTKAQIIADPGTQQITIEREFDASPELLYRAWTDPDLLVQWLGPRDYTMKIDHYDARDGGSWRYTHTDPEGNEYGFHGVFHGTPSVNGMVQTFEFEGAPGHVSLDSLTFEQRGGKTLVRTNSVFQSVEARDAMIESGMEYGVHDSYARLDDLLPALTAKS